MVFNTGSEKSLFHYTSMTTLVIGSDSYVPIDIGLDLVSLLNLTLITYVHEELCLTYRV